tara:strand:+ start:46823 stop:47905 length:1083 start_codon:yes stop_codon:yes gene_type:complete
LSRRIEQKILIWFVLLGLVLGFFSLASAILLPFIIGIAIAYFLDPLADKIEELGLSRVLSTIVITLMFFCLIVGLFLIFGPLLNEQIKDFFDKLPVIFANLGIWLEPIKAQFSEYLDINKMNEISESTQSFGNIIVKWLGNLFGNILKGSMAMFNALSVILITPVVCFYLLKDWDKILSKIDGLLPLETAPAIRILAKNIDSTIAGFVRGQVTVCIILSIIYALGLTSIGLDFGLVIGLLSGLMSFIPYIGFILGLIVALIVAFSQFDLIYNIFLVVFVFGLGQIIESVFLTPKLIGDKIGLHPVWIIFSLMFGGSIYGFLGILLAIPVAATLGVLLRFGVTKYLESSIYSGYSKTKDKS